MSPNIQKVVILAVSSFIISLIIFLSGILDTFELKAYDLFSRHLNPSASSDDIVIIKIDQESLDDTLNQEGIPWPWPRQIYVRLVEYLSESDAVFIDILFTEHSSYGIDDDAVFAEFVRKAGNVYLPVFLTKQQKVMTLEDEKFISRIAIESGAPSVSGFNSAITPIDVLKDSVAGSGNVTISPDKDGVYRRMPFVFQLRGQTVPNFILGYLIEKGLVRANKSSFYAKNTKIPLTDGNLILRYDRKSSPFKTFSARQVFRFYHDNNRSTTPAIRKDFFKGKVVFIGPTAAGLYDLKPTSVSSISTGVHVHATAFDNIIRRDFIRPVSRVLVVGFMLLICVFISYSVLKSHSLLKNLSVFILSLIIVLSITAALFREALYMNIISPAASLTLSFIIAVAYSYATEGRQRLLLKATFSQYMDKKIADYLLENPSLIKPGGKMRRVTVFFTDVAGFTSIAEITPAEEIARILHTVLNSLTNVIIENQGVIDKYIGDSIMAFWGAPVDSDKDELNACHAAARCLDALAEINSRFREENTPPIDIRIGIHTGHAVAGNIGSDRLFHYTVIGDTVNLASRLESANKFFQTRIIVSEDTLKETGGIFLSRELGLIAVKGKIQPIKIFELIGEERNVEDGRKQLIALFNQAMAFYKEKRWHESLDTFGKILEDHPDDGPAEFYKTRCEYILSNPHLTENWDVIKFTEK